MCTNLLACPLCSQPAFLTLDALRTGLISVATRPLACPVCNEVLLGVDKLTIHLFSHAISLSSDGKANGDQTRITDGNSFRELHESVRKEQIIPIQTWNVLNKHSKTRQSFAHEDNAMKHKVAIAPLRKIASARNPRNTKNGTISTGSQTCSENLVQCNEAAPLMANQLIFVQSSQQAASRDANGFVTDEIYLQSIPKERQTSELNCAKAECRQENEKSNLSKQTRGAVEESYPKSVLEFQPIWMGNPQQEICVQNILVGTSNSSNTGQASRQILTISPKKLSQSNEASLQPAATSMEDNNAVATRTEASENHRRSPDQSQVLPQLKAFKALAIKEKTERCDVCGFYFSDPKILTLHKQLVHMINEKDLDRRPEDLLKNYPCHLCPKVFKMRGSLMVHMRVAHIGYNLGSLPKDGDPLPIPGENGYNCPTCGKNFKKEQHVTQHLKTHEGKQWECDVCSKMFTTKYFLKKHKRLHSGEMPYKCNICDKTFTFQQSYHKHRLYHKDDKPHACSTCGRSFKELSTLHNHERIHTGEKPFACETCGKCFRQRVSYLVHRRIHTGAMPYKCTACGKSFRYKLSITPRIHKIGFVYCQVSQRTHKCTAQPPGTVVRQSSDLVQRLRQVSQIRESGERESSEGATSRDTEASVGCIPNEDNRYILIINNQGQHVLTRESEVENKGGKSPEAERSSELNNYEEGSGEAYIEHLWGHNIPDGTTLKDSMEISVRNNSVEEREFPTDGNNDFFSMVLSPSENEVRSPSNEMEHLRLSSPTGEEKILEMNETAEVLQTANNFQCAISKDIVQDNFRGDNGGNAALPLPTINEESLKQLLYGTETGQQ